MKASRINDQRRMLRSMTTAQLRVLAKQDDAAGKMAQRILNGRKFARR